MDVFDKVREARGPITIDGIVAEKVAVLLHVRATTSRVNEDGIGLETQKAVDVLAAEGPGFFDIAVVGMQGTTADLIFRGDNVNLVAGEYSESGMVGLAKGKWHHTACEEGHASAGLANWSVLPSVLWTEEGLREVGSKSVDLGEARSEACKKT